MAGTQRRDGRPMTAAKGARSREPETVDVADEAKWTALAQAIAEVEQLMARRAGPQPGRSAGADLHVPPGRTPPFAGARAPRVGDRVRVGRDEGKYPSKGTWPQFRGRTGTVVGVNADRKRPHLTGWGVSFRAPFKRPDGSLGSHDITWFKDYEMRTLGLRASPSHPRRPPR
jgi:hypothetical protein